MSDSVWFLVLFRWMKFSPLCLSVRRAWCLRPGNVSTSSRRGGIWCSRAEARWQAGWSPTWTTVPSWRSTVTTAASASKSLPSTARSESLSRTLDLMLELCREQPLHPFFSFSFSVRVVTLQAESRRDCEEVKWFLVMWPSLFALFLCPLTVPLLLPPPVDLHHQQHLQKDLPEWECRGVYSSVPQQLYLWRWNFCHHVRPLRFKPVQCFVFFLW